MALYRKKPVEIEALRFEGTKESTNRILAWIGNHGGSAIRKRHAEGYYVIVIDTLEGGMMTKPGDWIIRGVQGEFYPCKPNIFEATYDEVAI